MFTEVTALSPYRVELAKNKSLPLSLSLARTAKKSVLDYESEEDSLSLQRGRDPYEH